MPIRVGCCTACGTETWRSAEAQREDKDQGIHLGQRFLLWPVPSSVYIQTWTPTGHTVGIGYCAACVPSFGTPGPVEVGEARVVGHEAATSRYGEWYTDEKGEFLRAWLVDALGYDEAGRDQIMAVWEQDRVA